MSAETTPRFREAPGWLFGAVLVLLALAPGQLAYAVDRKHGPFIAYADLVAVAVIALWGLWVLATRRLREITWPPRQTWALLIVAVLAGLGAESLKAAALEIIQIGLYFILAYMLFCDVIQGERRLRVALLVLLAAVTVAVGYGLAQYLTGIDPQEVRATFQSRHAYGGFLVMVLPLFYGLLLRSQRLWERLWAGAVLLAGAVTMLAPGLVFLLALVLTLMTLNWGPRGRHWAYLLGIVAVLAVTLKVLPANRASLQELRNPYEEGPIYKSMEAGGSDQPIVKKRWIEWMPALNMMAENFFLGVGTGNYQLNIGRPEYYGFLPNVKKSEADTNNLYLVTAGSMGFAGLVALLGFVGYFGWRGVKLWIHLESDEERVWAAGLYGLALAAPLVNVLTSLFVRGTSLVWILGYALIIVLSGPRRVPLER